MLIAPSIRWWLLAAGCAHLALLFPLPPLIQAIAVLLLTGLLPGWLLVQLLVGRSAAPPDPAEQWLYALSAGYSSMVIVTLLLSYLPGGLTWWQALLGFDGVVILLLVASIRPGKQFDAPRQLSVPTRGVGTIKPLRTLSPCHLVTLSAFLLFLLASFLRFPNLGFAEFHGDEARAILRAAAVLQGNEEVLLLHKKGPTEILLPALLWSLTGEINELTARLPFAVAGVGALLAVFALGWRMLGPLAGWLAAWLLVFDGYFIAFARFVQYQSVVLLLSTLAVLIAWRLLQQPQAINRSLPLLALFWATGLLSHYDMLAVGVALGFLLGALRWQLGQPVGRLLRAALPALGVGVGIGALFYVPFVLHPRFQGTTNYLIEERLVAGRTLPYNNLADVFARGLVYSSAPLLFLFVGLGLVALLTAYRNGFPARLAHLLIGATLLVAGVVYWRPQWLIVNQVDLTFVPIALLLLAVWLAPRLALSHRLLWFWLGTLWLLAFFGIANARTHVYIFFVPWALLIGGTVAHGWQQWAQPHRRAWALAVGGATIGLLTLGLGGLAYAKFGDSTATTLRDDVNRPNPIGSLYGLPFANGWKVVGALYAQGVLQGDYETNERYDWTPSWYTQGQHRCGSTATWYFAVDRLEPWIADRRQLEDTLSEQGYRPWGVVTVADVERMVIYRQTGGAAIDAVQRFRQADYEAVFDQQVHADLPLTYPAVEEQAIAQPLAVNFADQLWLRGYKLEHPTPLKASDRFRLTLYWEAQHLIEHSYTVFVQAYYGAGVMVAQKDSVPVCARAPTNSWTPGELISDVYDVTVAADAPAGSYPLFIGLYRPEDLTRLPVFDAAGAAVDQQVRLTDLLIGTVP